MSTKVPLNPTKEQVEPTTSAGEQEKLPLPGWSEKMGQGILTGEFISKSPNEGEKNNLYISLQSVVLNAYTLDIPLYKKMPTSGCCLSL